jgi:serine protease Do
MENTSLLTKSLTTAMDEIIQHVRHGLVEIRGHRFGEGAGIIWDDRGLILTNNHVIGHSVPRVLLSDEREFEARILARDADIDLALLEIDARQLIALMPAPGLPRVGEIVFALGHPWGQRGYLTHGMVSAIIKAHTTHQRDVVLIRTDVPLAPGSSGGPLINTLGQVVGINSMIIGGDQSVSIPVTLIHQFVADVLSSKATAI